jgi:hypothetical protein
MGDHTESVEVDFDPSVISYKELLGHALAQGSFGGRAYSKQYRSVVFYHSAEQKAAAQALGINELEPFRLFTRAEDYHQKYYLQQSPLAKDFYAMFPGSKAFTDSTAVTRANAIVGGHVPKAMIQSMLPSLGVGEAAAQKLLKLDGRTPTCALPQH